MRHKVSGSLLILFALLAMAPAGAAGKKRAPATAGGGAAGVVALKVEPEKAELWGPGAAHALLATAFLSDGTQRDVTGQATWRTEQPGIARVGANGVLSSVADGATRVVAQWSGRSAAASVKVTDSKLPRGMSFANDIVPIFTKAGCN